MKRTIKFLDANRKLVVAECEITNRNGYPEFTMSGDYNDGCGQVFDHVLPFTEDQEKLINIWREWHLNGMNAGTEKQQQAIEEWRKNNEYDYEKVLGHLASIDRKHGGDSYLNYQACKADIERLEREIRIINKWYNEDVKDKEESKDYYDKQLLHYTSELSANMYSLKNTLLYDTHPTTGEDYKYGCGWITKELPDTFEDDLNELLDAIEEYEEEQKERKVTDDDTELFSEFTDHVTAHALAMMFELSVNEVEDIIEEGNNRWCVQGVDYLAGTDEDMDILWDEDLDNYIDECILPDLPETAQRYFDNEAWKRDARYDGRAHSLNRYDGNEMEYTIYGNTIYAYRQ